MGNDTIIFVKWKRNVVTENNDRQKANKLNTTETYD